MLTRAEIDTMRPRLLFAMKDWKGSEEAVDALCDMALAWLGVQPVKIKDLPIDCDSAIGLRSDGLHIIFRYGMDRWSTSAISRLWQDDDYAIPLSAILALKTPDKVT